MTTKTTEVIIPPVDAREEEESNELVALANDWVIDSEDVRGLADKDLARIKAKRKWLEGLRTGLKEPILEAGRRVDGMFKPLIASCETAESVLSRKILGYDRELAAARAEEQRKLDAQAAEARAKLEEQSKALEAAGNTEAAAAIKEAAVLVSAPHVPIAVTTAARSTAKRETWHAEVVDLMELVKAVAAGQAPIQALEANTTYLNGRARLEKSDFKLAGVKAVGEETLVGKRGA